jgi:hypothetical protein
MVLLLSIVGKFLELHFRQCSTATLNGLGRLCSAVSLFLHLSDFELHWPSRRVSFVLLGSSLKTWPS